MDIESGVALLLAALLLVYLLMALLRPERFG
jgi:K+-transporting ATPase KdpF subunit